MGSNIYSIMSARNTVTPAITWVSKKESTGGTTGVFGKKEKKTEPITEPCGTPGEILLSGNVDHLHVNC